MIEMKTTKDTKSLLAKLLASENVIVEHGKFNTASFDVKNRVLRLPIWKEMSGSLYDLLVLHEVGHALYTPEDGLHEASGMKAGFKSYLNVVEDARIERKIKNKFPGGRTSFTAGYKDLMNRDFFGVKGIDLNKLNLIDKINLYYKVGEHLDISFSDIEKGFLDRIDKAETFKTVMKICEDLYEYSMENESETDMSDHSMASMMFDDDMDDDDMDTGMEGNESFEMNSEDKFDEEENGAGGSEESEDDDVNDKNDVSDPSKEKREEGAGGSSESESDGSNDEDGLNNETAGASSGREGGTTGKFDPDQDPGSITDSNFRNNESELVCDESKPYRYINLPTNISLKEVVVDFKEIHSVYRKFYADSSSWDSEVLVEALKRATEGFKDFRNKNKKVVEYLAKEFEMKQAARDHKRAATANSGIIDSEKLHTYKYNEHIFKKLTVVPDGKNHGLVMFVDWSGSMSQNMKGTIDQMMVLVMFCKRVNIPFEVYAFSDSYFRYSDQGKRPLGNGNDREVWDTYLCPEGGEPNPGDLVVPRFSLLNLFSSRMRAKDLHEAYIHMMATSMYYTSRYDYGYRSHVPIPDRMNLGGTPLDSTLMMSFSIMRDFISRNQVDVVNSIFLTDGDSHTNSQYFTGADGTVGHYDIWNENVILRDPVSKKQFPISRGKGRYSRQAMTRSLVKFSREVFNINIVNFFLINRMKKWDMVTLLDDLKRERGESINTAHTDLDEADVALKKFRKDKYFVAPEACGFNDQYMILGGKNLEVEEQKLEVGSDATPAQLARAFKSFSKGKLEKRKLLSRFIDMVAK